MSNWVMVLLLKMVELKCVSMEYGAVYVAVNGPGKQLLWHVNNWDILTRVLDITTNKLIVFTKPL